MPASEARLTRAPRVPYTLYFPADLRERLEQYARAEERPASFVVREAVRRLLDAAEHATHEPQGR